MLDAISDFVAQPNVGASTQASSSDTFTQALAQRTSRLVATNAAEGKATQTDDLREAAGQLVATAFLLPLMAEARNSTFKSDLFGGGFAQDAMREKLDVQFADRLAASDRFPLTDALVKHLDQTA